MPAASQDPGTPFARPATVADDARSAWLLLGLCIVAATVCLALRAWHAPLPWLDEAFTLLLADVSPIKSAYLSYAYDWHGPVYFGLLSIAHAVTGSHLLTYTHSYFLLAGVVALLALGRSAAFPPHERIVAASLLVVMPYALHMADQMRMYTFEAMLALGLWSCLVLYCERQPKALPLVLALLLALLAAYAHVMGFLIGCSAILFLAVATIRAGPADSSAAVAARRFGAALFGLAFGVLAIPAIGNFLLRAVGTSDGMGHPTGLDLGDAGIALGVLGMAEASVVGGWVVAGVILAAVGALILPRSREQHAPAATIRLATWVGFVLFPIGIVGTLGLLGEVGAAKVGFYAMPFLALMAAALIALRAPGRKMVIASAAAAALAVTSLYEAMAARPEHDYAALARYLEETPHDQPIGFFHIVDLWMLARQMGAADIEPERFVKPITELGPVARRPLVRRLLEVTGIAGILSWQRISAFDARGRLLRLERQDEAWPYDTPIVSSWGQWSPFGSGGCESRQGQFILYRRQGPCA